MFLVGYNLHNSNIGTKNVFKFQKYKYWTKISYCIEKNAAKLIDLMCNQKKKEFKKVLCISLGY